MSIFDDRIEKESKRNKEYLLKLLKDSAECPTCKIYLNMLEEANEEIELLNCSILNMTYEPPRT